MPERINRLKCRSKDLVVLIVSIFRMKCSYQGNNDVACQWLRWSSVWGTFMWLSKLTLRMLWSYFNDTRHDISHYVMLNWCHLISPGLSATPLAVQMYISNNWCIS